MADKQITHQKYGKGVVTKERFGGSELFMKFENGLSRWVKLDEVDGYVTETVGKRKGKSNAEPSRKPVSGTAIRPYFKMRRMVEAFRLGIVPCDCVDDFTFGRDDEIGILRDWLTGNTSNSMILAGEYGTGKTHLLNFMEELARREGYAVASVSMDPNESPFHKPKRVYGHLVKAFTLPSKDGKQVSGEGFRDLIKRALVEGSLRDHEYFKQLHGKTDDPLLWDWIEAAEASIKPGGQYYYWENPYKSLPALYDYSSAINIYCYLLSALGWVVRKVLGLKGLLLIFDEAESVDIATYRYQVEKNVNVLKALIRTASSDNNLTGDPSESQLEYCQKGIASNIPFLYKKPSSLKMLFAFTPTSALNSIVNDEKTGYMEIASLSEGDLREVFTGICSTYEHSYDHMLPDTLSDGTFDMILQRATSKTRQTRLIVKGSVEALDLIRFNRGKTMEELLPADE